MPALVEAFNRQPDAPFRIQHRHARRLRGARGSARRPAGDPRRTQPDLPGHLQQPHRAQAAHARAGAPADHRREAGACSAAGWASPADADILWRAWEPMLFNQTHDLMSGVMTDHVYEDTLHSYDFSRRIAEAEVQAAAARPRRAGSTRAATASPWSCSTRWAGRAPTSSSPRVGFTEPEVVDVQLVDPDGRPVPVQILDVAAARQRRAVAGRRRLRGPRRAGAGPRRLPRASRPTSPAPNAAGAARNRRPCWRTSSIASSSTRPAAPSPACSSRPINGKC